MMGTGAMWTVLTTDPATGHRGRLASIIVMGLLILVNGVGALVTRYLVANGGGGL